MNQDTPVITTFYVVLTIGFWIFVPFYVLKREASAAVQETIKSDSSKMIADMSEEKSTEPTSLSATSKVRRRKKRNNNHKNNNTSQDDILRSLSKQLDIEAGGIVDYSTHGNEGGINGDDSTVSGGRISASTGINRSNGSFTDMSMTEQVVEGSISGLSRKQSDNSFAIRSLKSNEGQDSLSGNFHRKDSTGTPRQIGQNRSEESPSPIDTLLNQINAATINSNNPVDSEELDEVNNANTSEKLSGMVLNEKIKKRKLSLASPVMII